VGADVDSKALRLRRDQMLSLLADSHLSRRVKRGLIDLGGEILSTLFGVATTSQLGRFKEALKEVSGSQATIRHAQFNLATVINHTRALAKELSLRQRQVELHQIMFKDALRKLQTAVNLQAQQINRLEVVTDLDRYLDVMDLAVKQYVAQIALYNRQRTELAAGRLTRDLLPAEDLRDILRQAGTQHQVIMSIDWYYRYISVSPIGLSTGSLIYRIMIPLVAPRPYLLYQITTLPVPVANSSVRALIDVKSRYAIDTVSGNLFNPTKCWGNSPKVCESSPEFDNSVEKCARGLITNRPDLVKQCKINVTHSALISHIITLKTSQYGLSTRGETLLVRCPGRPESHIKIKAGAKNVTCVEPCTILGAGWSLSCTDQSHVKHLFYQPTLLVSAQFNFSSIATKVNYDTLLLPDMTAHNSPSQLQMQAMTLTNQDWLAGPPRTSQNQHKNQHSFPIKRFLYMSLLAGARLCLPLLEETIFEGQDIGPDQG
jgi:hypothetical protein